ncbi:glycosyltransferase family 4 protein [Halalkalicoccus salilacus]|uniref:glycosyltransferase family 4 protein n=1 Tax=Halalkalicoccus salilacus TaxID=3117459 RepID=UPI00300EF55C
MTRIIIISPGHSPERSSRQPWAYIQGIADKLSECGHDVLIVGDGPKDVNESERPASQIKFVDSVRSSSKIERVADVFNPDICLWSVGPPSSLYLSLTLPQIADRMIAVIPGPLYTTKEIVSQLSINDIMYVSSYSHLVMSSIIPQQWFSCFLQHNFNQIIVPTNTLVDKVSSNRLLRRNVFHIPHGVDTGILATSSTQNKSFRENIPDPPDQSYILNFGPPRPIRGAQDFIKAILLLRDRGYNVTGVLLARIDNKDDSTKLREINRHLSQQGERDAFLLIDKHLSPIELKRFIQNAAAVALPYRIVQSTVPVSILEALTLGCPVITTKIQGAQELIPSPNWTVPPKDAGKLATALEPFLTDEKEGEDYLRGDDLASHLPSWTVSIEPLTNELPL